VIAFWGSATLATILASLSPDMWLSLVVVAETEVLILNHPATVGQRLGGMSSNSGSEGIA